MAFAGLYGVFLEPTEQDKNILPRATFGRNMYKHKRPIIRARLVNRLTVGDSSSFGLFSFLTLPIG